VVTTIKALLFDFDGLILETERPAFQAWDEIFRDHGVELSPERWRDYIGREGGWFDVYTHLEELTGRPVDRDALKSRRAARRDELLAAQELERGVAELFTEALARGLKVGVVSSSTREWVCGHLERLAFMNDWDAIVCRADAANAKPAPDLYLRAIELLGVAPYEAVALEDSPNGIASAKAAGLWCVAVPNPLTRDLDLSRADVRLDSLANLPLDQLLAVLSRT
jgi:HAD superfamily hydrolase (TIGR01509 family)